MKMTELIRYDFPPEVIQLWGELESQTLLPVQELAVKRYGLFDKGNLLVQAPTSSGKTFIGEMAAVHTALRRKKVVYLVPLKALAEEKYFEFKEKYDAYGLHVIISTRDHREFDAQLEDGAFSIAVVVYEKLSQLLVRRPERIEEIELVIADELELLSDPERGAMAELLLARILQSRCRLIGLSAVIGETEKLAEWMKAQLVFYEQRPVELRYGVLHEGIFRYRTYNDYGEGSENLADTHAESYWEILTANVCALVEQGETCLVFVKAKHEARRGAESLARHVPLARAAEAIAELRSLEPTRSRECLLNALNSGVAFHNADLSPDERRIVERAFRAGEVKVLVSTSTLAVGLNLPAQNVFIAAEKWRYDSRFGMPWKAPIRHANTRIWGAARAATAPGKCLGGLCLLRQRCSTRRRCGGVTWMVTANASSRALAHESLENHVLRLVASRFCRSEVELRNFLESTLTGKWVWLETLTLGECEFKIRTAVNAALDAGVLAKDAQGRLEATPLGVAVAAKGISIATARLLEQWIMESENRVWDEIDLLLAATLTPDGRMLQVSLTAREYEHADYVGQLARYVHNEAYGAKVPIGQFYNHAATATFDEVRAVKTALFLMEWLDQAALYDIEEQFHTMTGQILSAADQTSWLLDACAAIAVAVGAKDEFVERIKGISERVQRGVREETLPLARLAGPETSRNVLSALVAHQLHRLDALAQAPVELLSRWMAPAVAKSLRQRVVKDLEAHPPVDAAEEPENAKAPILVIDDRRPGAIHVDGARVPLQEKQYQLIRTLAANPSECVSYDAIYCALWGDNVVEPAQMHFQKRKLLASIAAASPQRTELVTTVPKRGFMLNLAAEEVALYCAA